MSAVLESEIKLTERSDEIRAALDHLLESHCFRNSRRNVRFLRVIVGKTLGGQAHEIKERTLGVEVFDRAPEYDLSSDPIVRVAAGDIRKRLAQYYEEEGKHATIRLRLPLGTYVPEFVSLPKQADVEPPEAREFQLPVSHAEAPAEELPPPPERVLPPPPVRKTGYALAMAAAAAVAIGCFFLQQRAAHREQIDVLWSPWIHGGEAVICVGDLNSFLPESIATLTDTSELNKVMSARNHVGSSDAAALARIAAEVGHYGGHFHMILADDANLTDLRSQPGIFIGAMNNQWSLRLLSEARFRITQDPLTKIGVLTDTKSQGASSWVVNMKLPISAINRDYGLITRMVDPLTGQPALVVEGIGPYGTTAASEFVTNPTYFEQFAAKTTQWKNSDLQIVVRADVVNGRSAPPQLVAYDIR